MMLYDIAIIGGGPAGLTSAIYGARAARNIIIFESVFFGGQVINSNKIDNYPGLPGINGVDFATRLLEQVKTFQINIKNKDIIKVDLKGDIKKIYTRDEEIQAKAVIIATGSAPKKLNLDREKELTGLGVSYCATCDGAFYKNKSVAVVGGGNTALDDALYISNFSKKVYLIHRRNKFRADELTVNKVKGTDNIEILYDSVVSEIFGTDNLSHIKVKNENTAEEKLIDLDGVFIAIGNIPNTEIFKEQIKLNERGFILTDSNLKTNIEKVYAVGDVIEKRFRQIVTAQSDGVVAVSSLLEEL